MSQKLIDNMKPYSSDEDFKKKREQFQTNVRRANRQSVIMKRRNIDFNDDDPTIIGEKKTQKDNLKILDESMRTYLTEIMKKTYTEDDREELLNLLHSRDILDKHRAAYGLRILTYNEQNGPTTTQLLLAKSCLDQIVSWYTQDQYMQLKFESLWIITNLISYSAEACEQFVEKMNILISVSNDVLHKSDDIKLRAIWAVANIAAQSTKYRDLLIQQGSIIKIIKYLEAKRGCQQITTSIWALTNLARGKPQPKYQAVKHVIPPIAQAIKQKLIKGQRTLSDCLWTLANLSEGAKTRLQRILETNVIPSIIKYLRNKDLKLSVPALRLIGNFTTGNKQQTQQVLKNKFLDEALVLLDHQKSMIIKQTCWALSNITAGNDEQILQFLQRTDIIHKLIKIYPSQTNEVKSQIIWIFSNLERSDIPEIIQKFMQDLGLIKMIGEMLKCGQEKCILDALVCLNRILVMGDRCVQNSDENNKLAEEFISSGLIPTLQDAYNHPSQSIERESKKILDRFFSSEEKECERMRD